MLKSLLVILNLGASVWGAEDFGREMKGKKVTPFFGQLDNANYGGSNNKPYGDFDVFSQKPFNYQIVLNDLMQKAVENKMDLNLYKYTITFIEENRENFSDEVISRLEDVVAESFSRFYLLQTPPPEERNQILNACNQALFCEWFSENYLVINWFSGRCFYNTPLQDAKKLIDEFLCASSRGGVKNQKALILADLLLPKAFKAAQLGTLQKHPNEF